MPGSNQSMQIGALIIGDEILIGRRQDRHFQHVIATLGQRGLELAWVRYAGDDIDLLTQHFREIRDSGALCFSFGGIGATPDDRTRQAMAVAHHVPIVPNAEAVQEIESQFGSAAYPSRILMADLPQGAVLIPNAYNRVPGFSLGHIHCLPGFPEMAWPMLEWVLNTHYPDLKAERPAFWSVTIHDTHESDLVELMNALQSAYPQVKLSSLPRLFPHGGREIELGLKGGADDVQAASDELLLLLGSRRIRYSSNR